jgi:hypothetical protein
VDSNKNTHKFFENVPNLSSACVINSDISINHLVNVNSVHTNLLGGSTHNACKTVLNVNGIDASLSGSSHHNDNIINVFEVTEGHSEHICSSCHLRVDVCVCLKYNDSVALMESHVNSANSHVCCYNNFDSNDFNNFGFDEVVDCTHQAILLPPPMEQLQQVDVCKYNYGGAFYNLSNDFDKFYCSDDYNAFNLDFNVNDILCNLKFKFVNNFVCDCSICCLSVYNNVHFMHHSFGFINLAPLVISQNIPGPPLVPNFHNYLAIQNLYTGSPNFISKIAPIASHINVGLFRELCQGFHDQQIFDLIQFGFPLDLDKSTFFSKFSSYQPWFCFTISF